MRLVNRVFEYKGYRGSVEYSDADGLYYGEVLNAHGMISYEGTSVRALEEGFHDAVDDFSALPLEHN